MLNNQTKEIMKELLTIGSSAIIEYPYTTVTPADKSVIAFLNVQKTNEKEFEPFGIFYLNEFLGLLDFFENAEISINNGLIDIKTNNAHQVYETTDLRQMEAFKVPHKAIENIKAATNVGTLTVSSELLEKMKKIASLLNLTSFIVDLSNNKIIVTNIDDSGNFHNPSEFDVNINSSGNSKIVIDISNISKLPSWDYNILFARNENTGNIISLWEGIDKPVEIIVSIKEEI